ncbi:unnamed protein product [marine sediment metagenome]|uniref:Uncharacterized protein n=1 Tax=marine sediment metagenome TaxID=412755 RepID=X1GTW3_9ZZZZ
MGVVVEKVSREVVAEVKTPAGAARVALGEDRVVAGVEAQGERVK